MFQRLALPTPVSISNGLKCRVSQTLVTHDATALRPFSGWPTIRELASSTGHTGVYRHESGPESAQIRVNERWGVFDNGRGILVPP